ncbi:MAG TPA: glycosyltransferase family 4 protein [Solirubrobacteraceae bacterium]|nr:glycosyltransferase family 4 protein [Solirubrobacteraceae bacterium]
MRILIFHGYLLGGTGSNVYNARLAEALAGLGHEVHLLSQERHPEEHAFIDAYGDWDSGVLRVTAAAGHGGGAPGCTVYRPDIGGLLPVYVADRYEGIEARTFADCTDQEIERYVEANVRAVREVSKLVRPQLALANHLVMGPAILARGLGGEVPYAVKIHGSALEYTVKPEPGRFLPAAREGLAGARGVLVGSRHTAESLWAALGDLELAQRTRLGPPGVDVSRFAPREPEAAARAPRELAARLRASAAQQQGVSVASAFARDELAVADALERLRPQDDELVAFVGKLIVSKGVDLLLAAWPLVLDQVPDARLAVIGFGAYRPALERMIAGLGRGDLTDVREIALAGRSLEDPSLAPRPLRHLLAFLDGLGGGEHERYVAAARAMPERVVLTGRLEHEELAELLPAFRSLAVPSTFPEAFGMVAVEAAACGVLPVSAAHSGLAEVSDVLARAVPERAARWLSFPVDDEAVRELAARLCGWLAADPELRSATRAGLVATARERWSWEGVGEGVIAAARGELEVLQRP